MAFMSKILTDGQIRFLLLCNRIIQWCSAVIVLGVNSSFIDSGPRGLFTTYVEIIAVISVAVFIPALMASFVKWTWVRASAFYIDFIFSYLWLTAFIFAALDFNDGSCRLSAPAGIACTKKFAVEAFIFLTFIFTVFSLFIENVSLWSFRRKHDTTTPTHEKLPPSNGEHHTATGATRDGPVQEA